MSDIQQNYDQPIINPVAKQPLFRKPRARRYDIQPGWGLKLGSRRTWWTGGAALVAVFLPHSFDAQETSERSYLPTVSLSNLIVDSRQPVDNYSKIRPICRIFTPALLNQPALVSREEANKSGWNLRRKKSQAKSHKLRTWRNNTFNLTIQVVKWSMVCRNLFTKS